jgi:hypothetical protein
VIGLLLAMLSMAMVLANGTILCLVVLRIAEERRDSADARHLRELQTRLDRLRGR